MHLRWTPAAVADLQHISDYLEEHPPRYRQATIRKLYEAVHALKSGRSAGVSDVRKERESFCSLLCRMSSSIDLRERALKSWASTIHRRIGLSVADNRTLSPISYRRQRLRDCFLFCADYFRSLFRGDFCLGSLLIGKGNTQGLKPSSLAIFTARLKPCPDTKHEVVRDL
jgi:plasmid stabilization system protein ParE